MTTGDLSCLILFAWVLLRCSERGGSEKFKMKIYVTTPRHLTTGQSALQTAQPWRLDEDMWFNILHDSGIQINKTIT